MFFLMFLFQFLLFRGGLNNVVLRGYAGDPVLIVVLGDDGPRLGCHLPLILPCKGG